MSDAVVSPQVNGTANGSLTNSHVNGTAAPKVKSSAAKSRGALKRLKAKQKGKGGNVSGADTASEAGTESDVESISSVSTAATSIDFTPTLDPSDPAYAAFASVFAHFQENGDEAGGYDAGPAKGQVYYSDDEDEDEEQAERRMKLAAESGMTRRERRKAAKLSVAELKQLVERPEVVEWFDCDARDPRLLVTLKSYRNTVPVPVHWNAKRDYLAGKKGIEKPPYLLPAWIAETGIGEQRDAVKAKEADQSLRQKTRERVQPKMGKIDIDYQKLHDAFFKFQGKPSMSKFGEAYYEGKELETDLRTKKPGELSDELVEALSIPPLAPPPWLIAMQRFGPPPSYPNLRIKGLNAPIPPGAQWGFHPGGWGKPPMDDFNRPLYGDVFGVLQGAEIAHQNEINRDLWGEIEPAEEGKSSDPLITLPLPALTHTIPTTLRKTKTDKTDEEEEEEDEEEEEEAPAPVPAAAESRTRPVPSGGTETPSGLATPSGYNSVTSTVPGGLETPDFVDLRKKTARDESEGPRELYQVIPERETTAKGFMGSSTAYDMSNLGKGGGGPGVLGAEDGGRKRKVGDVDISVEGDDDLTQEQLKAKYEASRSQAQRVHVPGADVDRSGFEDVRNEEMKKRQRKEERGEKGRGKEKAEKFKF